MKLNEANNKIKKPKMITVVGKDFPFQFTSYRLNEDEKPLHENHMTDEEHLKTELEFFNGFLGIIQWINARLTHGYIAFSLFAGMEENEAEKEIKDIIDYFCYYFQMKGTICDKTPSAYVQSFYNFLDINNRSNNIQNYFRKSIIKAFFNKVETTKSKESYKNKVYDFVHAIKFQTSNFSESNTIDDIKEVLNPYTNRLYKMTLGNILSEDKSYEFQEICFSLCEYFGKQECKYIDYKYSKILEDYNDIFIWRDFLKWVKNKNICKFTDAKKIVICIASGIFKDNLQDYFEIIVELMNGINKISPSTMNVIREVLHIMYTLDKEYVGSFYDFLILGNIFNKNYTSRYDDQLKPFFQAADYLNFFTDKEKERLCSESLNRNLDYLNENITNYSYYHPLTQGNFYNFQPNEIFTKKDQYSSPIINAEKINSVCLIASKNELDENYNMMNNVLCNSATQLASLKCTSQFEKIENTDKCLLDAMNTIDVFVSNIKNHTMPSAIDKKEFYMHMKEQKEYWKWVSAMKLAVSKLRETKLFLAILSLSNEFFRLITQTSNNVWYYKKNGKTIYFFHFYLLTIYKILSSEELEEKSKKIIFSNKINKDAGKTNNFKVYLNKIVELFCNVPYTKSSFWINLPYDNMMVNIPVEIPSNYQGTNISEKAKEANTFNFDRLQTYKDFWDNLIQYYDSNIKK